VTASDFPANSGAACCGEEPSRKVTTSQAESDEHSTRES